MIKKLFIQNYALIDRLEIDFSSGFSVITGETGAGKSIILGALSLILGQRADTKAVKAGASRCIIEGCFDIAAYDLKTFFERNDLEYDPAQCLIRREVQASGKSRAFINDTPVSLALLKELSESLIDIHSQHQNLLIGEGRFQLRVVDLLAANKEYLTEYRQQFRHYKQLQSRLKELKEETARIRREEDYLNFQLAQLQEAALKPGEQEELEAEQDRLSHTEEIKATLFTVYGTLNTEEGGILPLLKETVTRMQSLTRIYPDVRELAERLQSDYIDLKDIAAETEDRQERLNFDPERFAWVQQRLDTLYRLMQKHQVQQADELIRIQEELSVQVDRITHSEEQIVALEKEIAAAYDTLKQTAFVLTERRTETAKTLAARLEEKVRPLGLPNLRFEVRLIPGEQFDETGAEQVQFYFSANKNQPLQPVFEVASGGEISRLMLGVKALIAHATALPAIIFDEIDTGVSGDIADKMGRIMKDMSSFMQVVSITHLPQVAARGAHHYKVYKHDTELTTLTAIQRLTPEERTEEIARMLSGAELTEAALNNARVLLNS